MVLLGLNTVDPGRYGMYTSLMVEEVQMREEDVERFLVFSCFILSLIGKEKG